MLNYGEHLHLVSKQKFTLAKNGLSYITNHPHVSVALAAIIRVLYKNADKM